MSTPTASLPSLRAFLGAIACRATTTTSANRGLRSLEGALTESDADVQSVVNALVTTVDALDLTVGVSTGQKASTRLVGTYEHDASTTGTETVVSYAYSGASAYVDLYEVEVTCISDDGLDAFVGKYFRGVFWTGAALTECDASTSIYEQPTVGALAAGCAFEIEISGANVRMRVTGTVDWKWGIAVRRTRRAF